MRNKRLALAAPLLLTACAGAAVPHAELSMRGHPHAGEHPAMYLERAGGKTQ